MFTSHANNSIIELNDVSFGQNLKQKLKSIAALLLIVADIRYLAVSDLKRPRYCLSALKRPIVKMDHSVRTTQKELACQTRRTGNEKSKIRMHRPRVAT